MKACSRAVLLVLCCAGLAAPAAAGPLKLEIRNGLVTLDAQDVTVRDILAEWARVGKTRIENREQVGGGLVTLTLRDVPEKDALEILLRSVSGYIAAPRSTPVADASIYDAVFVLATARPAVAQGGGTSTVPSQQLLRGGGRAGQGQAPGQIFRQVQPADDTADDALPPVMRPGYIMEQMAPGQGGASPVQIQMAPGVMPPAMQTMQGGQSAAYPGTTGNTATPGTAPAGATAGSTSIPGVVATPTPGTTAKPIKPPDSQAPAP